MNSSQSTNKDIIKTTDASTNKNTIFIDNKKERNLHETAKNLPNQNENKYMTSNNIFVNGSNNTLNKNTVGTPCYQNSIRTNQFNDNEIKNKSINHINNNNLNQDHFMNKFKQNDVSYSEMDDSKISESDKLSSYAPSERTKSKFKII